MEDDKPKLLKIVLIERYELTQVTSKVMADYAKLADNKQLTELLKDKLFVRQYVESRDVLDMVSDFPATISSGDLLSFLRKLPPRLYSAACTQSENEEQHAIIDRGSSDLVSGPLVAKFIGCRRDQLDTLKNLGFLAPSRAACPETGNYDVYSRAALIEAKEYYQRWKEGGR